MLKVNLINFNINKEQTKDISILFNKYLDIENNKKYIGILEIPRFGNNYHKLILEGVENSILDQYNIGHYPHTSVPGEIGNIVLTGHRQSGGEAFDNIEKLQSGDIIYIYDNKGRYTYKFRNNEVILPNQLNVLNPIPNVENKYSQLFNKETFLTLISCNPKFGNIERFVVYAILEFFEPFK